MEDYLIINEKHLYTTNNLGICHDHEKENNSCSFFSVFVSASLVE